MLEASCSDSLFLDLALLRLPGDSDPRWWWSRSESVACAKDPVPWMQIGDPRTCFRLQDVSTKFTHLEQNSSRIHNIYIYICILYAAYNTYISRTTRS